MNDVSLDIIIDTLLWYKTWLLSGYNPTQGKTKTSQETQKSLQKFLEPTRKPKAIYTDNSLEFGKACEDLSWIHCMSTPHRSETNGIAGRAVRRIKEGTSAVLLQSGLDNEQWIPWNVVAICETFKISRLMGEHHVDSCSECPLTAPVISFGAMVEYHLISSKYLSRLHLFGPQVFPGIFLGYVLYAVGIWKGADIEALEEKDASELHARRLNAKEVLSPMQGEKFVFPIEDGTVTIQIFWRRSGSENIHLDPGQPRQRRRTR